jgi:hypothetical protein
MAASFILYKYTGKDCMFGTPVVSLGLKRTDTCVPAVYGIPIVPADDKSDVNTYCVYRPDVPNEIVYSYETIWKMVLTVPPDHQLSNIRIWPERPPNPDCPEIPPPPPGCPPNPVCPYVPPPPPLNSAKVFIGESINFSRPTNKKSSVAIYDLYQFTRENPFYVTVNGNYGQHTNVTVDVINYYASLHDVGYGNVIYLNNVMQPNITIATGSSYQIVNYATGFLNFQLYDPATQTVIVSSDIVYSTTPQGQQVITINATPALMTAYPNGFVYDDAPPIGIGGHIFWLDVSQNPMTTIVYDVEVMYGTDGHPVYYLNGIENPVLNFETNIIYQFNNISGATDPLRFLNNPNATQANNYHEVIINGVTVFNGGTAQEVIYVDPSVVVQSGGCIRSYQSVYHSCFGNSVTMTNTGLVGNYNINTVGAGVANPLAAGETDFIYLQMATNSETLPGDQMPNIIIEWDEN